MQTEQNILGFTFYIFWDDKGEKGIDQNYNIWSDIKAPVPDNPEIMEIILDTYNDILKLQKEEPLTRNPVKAGLKPETINLIALIIIGIVIMCFKN
jgi:hypothetical protein